MKVLGIHDGHNASLCLIEDGEIVFAVQEERFTYVKNEGGFPAKSLEALTKYHSLDTIDHVLLAGDYVADTIWTRDSIIQSYSYSSNVRSVIRQWLKQRSWLLEKFRKDSAEQRLQKVKARLQKSSVQAIEHHLCHAAAAYYGSGQFDEKVLVITADGEGDLRSGSVYIGFQGEMIPLESVSHGDSLGRVYSYFTYLYNMVPYEHEYKIMGLAPYCNDVKKINECKRQLQQLINFADDEALVWSYRGKYPSVQSAGAELRKIFDGFRFDVTAAALQEFVEDTVLEWISRLIRSTGINHIVLSGGLFMNVKLNMHIAQLKEVRSVYVFPSCGDDSNSIGAAYRAWFVLTKAYPVSLSNYYLGDKVDVDDFDLKELIDHGWQVSHSNNIEYDIASLLAQGRVVGRIRGRMEFGARSLGNRAILANPSIEGVVQLINDMIKGRDFWMPFAPSVMEEDFEVYFERDVAVKNYEYMMFTARSKPDKRNYMRAALHPYDKTGRPQSVNSKANPDYHKLLGYYKAQTGESLILNTSYNLHGYPMVRTLSQVLDVFSNSGLEYLAVEDFLLIKSARV